MKTESRAGAFIICHFPFDIRHCSELIASTAGKWKMTNVKSKMENEDGSTSEMEAHMIQNSATRRTFLGSMATALGIAGFRPSFDLFAQGRQRQAQGQGEPGEEHPDEN